MQRVPIKKTLPFWISVSVRPYRAIVCAELDRTFSGGCMETDICSISGGMIDVTTSLESRTRILLYILPYPKLYMIYIIRHIHQMTDERYNISIRNNTLCHTHPTNFHKLISLSVSPYVGRPCACSKVWRRLDLRYFQSIRQSYLQYIASG